MSQASGGFSTSGTGQDVVVSVTPELARRVVAALAIQDATIRAGVLSGARTSSSGTLALARRVRAVVDAVMLPVLIAGGGAAWEAGLVAALDADPAVQVARRCVDVVDLLAAAGAGLGRAALVAADLRRLDADAVDRLIAAEVAAVGVVRRGDSDTEDRLRALGIDYLVPDDADPARRRGRARRGRGGGRRPGRPAHPHRPDVR